jgi:hypothetical protein
MGTVECRCPKIDLEEWRDREVALAGHLFLSSPTPLFFHVPRRFYQDLARLESRIEQERKRLTGAPLVLHRDGWFSGEVLVSIDPQPEPSPEAVSFRNLFYSRVVGKPGFDAALRQMPRFYADLRRARVGRILSIYFWYLTCPWCLAERGPERIILLARSERQLAVEPCPFEKSLAGPSRQALPCGV